jgi:prepilin-type N-terminal cleavage/methylation domain-containing protein
MTIQLPGSLRLHFRDRHFALDGKGFTLVEVLIAALVLLIVVSTSLLVLMSGTRAFVQARLRDDASERIASDLELLRANVNRSWRCIPGGTGADACAFTPGVVAFSDGQIAYQPPVAACANNSLAEAMVEQYPGLFAGNYTLSAVGSPPGAVAITRSIAVSGNQILIRYRTASGAPVALDHTSTLVPEALGWCP